MTLEKKLQETVKRINKRKFKVEAQVGDVPQHVDAYIDTQKWDVHVTVDRNIEASLQKIGPTLIPSKNLLGDLLYAASLHEFGHNQNPDGFFGCPGDEEYFKRIVEGIRDALEELKVDEARKDQLVPKIANFFEDYIVNSSYALKGKEREEFKSGMSAFYVLNSHQQQGTSFPPLFGQYVDMQLKTFWREGEIRDYAAEITKDYSQDLAKGLFRIFSDSDALTDKLMQNAMTQDDELVYYDELNDKEKWNLKVYDFTKKIYSLLDDQQQPNQGQGNQNNQDKSGRSSQGKSEDSGSSKGNGSDSQQQKGKKSDSHKSGSKEGSGKGNKNQSGKKPGKNNNGNEMNDQQQSPCAGHCGNHFTERYKQDTEFRERMNQENNAGQQPSYSPKKEQYQKPQQQGPANSGGSFGGMGQPQRMPVGFRMGRNSGFSEEDLEQIFQNPRRERYDIPDDFLPKFRQKHNGEIDLGKMYAFFESLAERMTVTPPKKGEEEVSRLPIGYLQRKRIERMGQAPLNEIDWESTMHLPNDDWSFFAKQAPIVIEEEGQPTQGSTKDICFIGDVSSSMGYVAPTILYGAQIEAEHLQGHDNFLTMAHSVIKDIKEKQTGYHLKYSSILFSDSTAFSGWHSYYELDNLLAWMYTGYQAGGTEFNAEVLQKMYQEASDKFLSIMLTDGAISNAEEAAQVVGEIIKAGNDFVLIEYQPSYSMFEERQGNNLTPFGQYVKRLGGEVHPISKIQDLFKITLGKVREMY